MKSIDNRTTGDKLLDSLKIETEVIGFSTSQLTLYIAQAEELIKKLAHDVDKYKEAYYILYKECSDISVESVIKLDKLNV